MFRFFEKLLLLFWFSAILHWLSIPFTKYIYRPGLKVSDDRITFEITGLKDISGDCEVNQRKGKLMSLFDMQMVLEFEALIGSESNAYNGSISIPGKCIRSIYIVKNFFW